MRCSIRRRPASPRGLRAGRLWLLIAACGLCSCSGTRVFLHPDADLDYYQTVGVVTFQSLAGDRTAGVKMTTAFTTELFISQKFAVMEPGAFREILRAELEPGRRDAAELTPRELQRMGEAAGVQGIFEGSVIDFEMARIGQDQFPLITLEIRLLDATMGQVVWSTSVTKRGGPRVPIFGWGETHTLGELAGDVAREAVGRLSW